MIGQFFIIIKIKHLFLTNIYLKKNSNSKVKIVGLKLQKFLNTVYLWGGKSALGLDCSGLVQLCLEHHDIPFQEIQKINFILVA